MCVYVHLYQNEFLNKPKDIFSNLNSLLYLFPKYILLINHNMCTHVPCSYGAEPPLLQIRQLRQE